MVNSASKPCELRTCDEVMNRERRLQWTQYRARSAAAAAAVCACARDVMRRMRNVYKAMKREPSGQAEKCWVVARTVSRVKRAQTTIL